MGVVILKNSFPISALNPLYYSNLVQGESDRAERKTTVLAGAGGEAARLHDVGPGAPCSWQPRRLNGGAELQVCTTWVIYVPLVFSTRGGVIALAVSWLNSNLGDYILPT